MTYKLKQLTFTIIVLSIFILAACNSKKSKIENTDNGKVLDKQCFLTINQIEKMVMGKPLNRLNDLGGCFVTKDTVIYEDDQIYWKGKNYYQDKHLRFLAESNWQDTVHVSRITFLDASIKTKDGIGVGSSLKDLKGYIVKRAAPNPDGFLSFYDAKDSAINYYMDITKYPKLANGAISNADEVPTELKVSSIVLNKK